MIPYTRQQPSTPSGVGPLTVYRSMDHNDPNLIQQPVQYIRNHALAFRGLEPDPTPAIALALQRSGVPMVAKVWTELAYESVRSGVAPGAPSRLDALYCTADPLDALSFGEVATDSSRRVHKGTVTAGTPWQLVNMAQFEVDHPTGDSEQAWSDAWNHASELANEYWAPADPSHPDFVGEILVAGAIELDPEPILILPLLRSLGLVT